MKMDIKAKIKNNLSSVVAAAIFLFVITFLLLIPNGDKDNKAVTFSEYSSINTICELATTKSFYHNVVMYEKEPDGGNKFVNDILLWPFGGYTQIGYKQYWLEYSGIVETGVDASQIKISAPTADGVVNVYIPEAKVLSIYADESSLTEPLSEKGWFTTISTQEKITAFAEAQQAMKEEAENDKSLLKRARESAKVLLERYIIATGSQMGISLSVNWVDTPQ